MGYTLTQLKDAAYNDFAERRAEREARSAGKLNGEVLGTTAIDPRGNEMVEITARFLENSAKSLEDPAFDCIMWQINWDDKVGLFADGQHKGSAIYYLEQIGETSRAKQLKEVIKILRSIFDVTGNTAASNYYLKSVDGIGALNENYRKLGVPSELTLQCYDDITWKLRTVAMQLNYVYYDRERQLEVLPKNLRRFTCQFFVSDFRDLRQPITALEMKTGTDTSLRRIIDDTIGEWQQKASDWIDDITGIKQVTDAGDKKPFAHIYQPSQFYKASDSKLDKQHVLVTCAYATISANAFPDSISNTEPAELGASLKLNVYDYDYTLLNHALDSIIDTLLQKEYDAAMNSQVTTSDGQTTTMRQAIADKKIGKAVLAGIWDTAKKNVVSKAKTAASTFCNSMIQYTKNKASSVLTTVTANAADQLGVNDIVQDIKQYSNPALLAANIDKWIDPFIDKVSGKVDYLAIAKSGYFTDKQTAQVTNLPDNTYQKKLE